jgi:hypothetical protein
MWLVDSDHERSHAVSGQCNIENTSNRTYTNLEASVQVIGALMHAFCGSERQRWCTRAPLFILEAFAHTYQGPNKIL